MSSPVPIARPSAASLPLQFRFQGQDLAIGTGFLVQRGDRPFLITNRHNVRGRNNDTDEALHSSLGVPDSVSILHNVAGTLGSRIATEEHLYAGTGEPRWHEHPVHGGAVDVVALELTDTDRVEILGHDPWASGPMIQFSPSSYLSIVGFPFGVVGGGGLAVWVQGSVATEPRIDWQGLPRFLIDSRTRPGQSGSPVLMYREAGVSTLEDGSTVVATGPFERFLGVYSGRIHPESDLGIVWRAETVAEIVDAALAS